MDDVDTLRKNVMKALEEGNIGDLKTLFDESDYVDTGRIFPIGIRQQEELFEKGIRTYGGGFAKKLLALYRKGDNVNRTKIRCTWPEIWIEYVIMGRGLEDDE